MKKLRPKGVPVGLIVGLVGVLLVSWCLTPIEAKTKEEVYQEKLARLKPNNTSGHYALGTWCVRNKLPEQAKTQFEKVIELKPDHSGARKKLGHFKYKGQWTSLEEMKAQGLVKYKGRWITYEKMMRAKGMVQFEGQWVTLSKKKKLEVRARKREALAKQFPYKGVLDKPGADSEDLPWEEARTKETDHFIIKTNLSMDALNDICFLLEYMHCIWQDFLFPEPNVNATKSKEKLKILVSKNRAEFKKISYDLFGYNQPSREKGTFVPRERTLNKSPEDHVVTYYFREDKRKTSNTLFHECTHFAVRACGPQPPTWLDEGLATYFSSSKVEGKKLVTNLINQYNLPWIKDIINKNTYMKLKDFINIPQSKYDAYAYDEGWSLVYFLLNGQGGRYKTGLQAYMEAWKKGKIVTVVNKGNLELQDKPAHLKLFKECMGVPIGQMEKEWKEYILGLKEDK